MHARILRNCRHAPALVTSAECIVGRPFGETDYRMPAATPRGADRVATTPGNEVPMRAGILKLLTKEYAARDIAVLSPWGSRSLAARIVAGEVDDPAHADDARWLRANLDKGAGRIRFGSISKLKGIETGAVVVTDVGTTGRQWANTHGLDWDDLFYVALTRAKYRTVVLQTQDPGPL